MFNDDRKPSSNWFTGGQYEQRKKRMVCYFLLTIIAFFEIMICDMVAKSDGPQVCGGVYKHGWYILCVIHNMLFSLDKHTSRITDLKWFDPKAINQKEKIRYFFIWFVSIGRNCSWQRPLTF